MDGAARTARDFTAYLIELRSPRTAPERIKYIEDEAIACYDLLNYSAEVCDLNSPKIRRVDGLVLRIFQTLKQRKRPAHR